MSQLHQLCFWWCNSSVLLFGSAWCFQWSVRMHASQSTACIASIAQISMKHHGKDFDWKTMQVEALQAIFQLKEVWYCVRNRFVLWSTSIHRYIDPGSISNFFDPAPESCTSIPYTDPRHWYSRWNCTVGIGEKKFKQKKLKKLKNAWLGAVRLASSRTSEHE